MTTRRAARGTGQQTHPRLPVLAVLGAAAAALALFARTLDGGLLSDDVLLNVLGTVTDDGFRVDWGQVLADFGRPWLGFDVPFYRPMLTVSFAVDQQLGGGAAWTFHLTNLLLHATVAGAAAALAAVLVPGRATAAAWIAGLCVAVHPVAVEPVAWIAARNSELEVSFRTLAMLMFALHLRRGARGARVAAIVLGACAFATKESAVMLPVSLVAIDVLDRIDRPWRERARLHLPFVLLACGYFALRLGLFGALLGDGGGTPTGSAWSRFAGKLGALGPSGSFVTAPLLGFVLAAGLFRARVTLLVGATWIALHAVPTWQLAVTDGLGGSRMVYGALPALGVVTARIVLDGAGFIRVAPLVAVATWAMLCMPTWDQLDRYDAAWRDMDDAKAGILALADRATRERPLAIAAMPANAPGTGIPPCNPNAWFPFAERPHQPRDVPVVSLGFVTVPVPLAGSLFGDASAIRAMTDHGSAILTWHAGAFLVRQRAEPAALPELRRDDDGARSRFGFALPLPQADAIAALTIHVVGGRPSAARVEWQTPGPDLPPELAGIDVGGGVRTADGARIEVDLTHHMAPPSLATFGIPVVSLTAALEGPGRVERIDAHARVPELASSHRPLAGRRVGLDELERTVTAPDVDAGATLRLVLQGPHAAIPVACEPGAAVRIPGAVRREFATFARISRQQQILFWFEALAPAGQPGFGRSRVDWFELAPARD